MPFRSPSSRSRTSCRTLKEGGASVWRRTCATRRLTDVLVAAVQNCLVAARRLADASQRLDDAQPELAALHALIDSDVLDVAYAAEVARELPLHEDGADADDGVGCT